MLCNLRLRTTNFVHIIADYLQNMTQLFETFAFCSFQLITEMNLQGPETSLKVECYYSEHFITFVSLYGNAGRFSAADLLLYVFKL